MRLLVLGGTTFLGRPIVERALGDGHAVTTFTRGRTNPSLHPDAERLHGDRTVDLSALTGRTWDAVIDTSTWLPRVVRLSAEALRDSVGLYCFVSSISAYADFTEPPVEGAPVATTDSDEETLENYGAFKARCERIVAEAYGERALNVRPGLIVGPHDPTGRFTYWPRRVAQGGDVLAPGSPDDPVQFVDVRDLGEWLVRLVGRRERGLFNATGLPLGFGELLETCKRVSGSEARVHWVPSERLLAERVGEWIELPLWLASPEYRAMQQADVSRAVAAGLTFRPLEETVRDTLAWDAERDESPAGGVGLAPERERELLAR